jgi:putative addiction module component (TIGR02574 family)
MSAASVPITVESLLNQAEALSDDDRAELAERLLNTLPALPEQSVVWGSEKEAEAAWQAELRQRLDDLDNDKAELIDGEQVFAELRAKLRENRGR